MADDKTRSKASTLLQLHRAPELLTVVNVWDVITAQVVAGVEGTRALATASHSIAASRGYEDGENIPVDEMIAEVGRIAASTHLPVSADLEGGYGNVLDFVDSVQTGTRLSAVTAFSTSKDGAGADAGAEEGEPAGPETVTGTVTLFIYALLDPAAG